MNFTRIVTTLVACVVVAGAGAAELEVGRFSKGDLAGWEERVFQGHTEYSLAEEDGKTVLAAHSNATASSLYRKIDVDLVRTPVLNWSWRVDHVLRELNEREKSGDDYPARVYLIFTAGSTFWKSRSLHYVWAGNQPPGAEWANAYGAAAQMIAVEAGDVQVGKWQAYKRNVRDDFKKYFGDDVQQLHAIAVMTDTDDSHQSAITYYGDIFFTAE